MTDKIKYLTVLDVCNHLNITENQVYKLLKRKQFEGIKIGKYWRIVENSFDEYIKRNSNMSTREGD